MDFTSCRAAAPSFLRVVSVVCLFASLANGLPGIRLQNVDDCAARCGQQMLGLGYHRAVNASLACYRTSSTGRTRVLTGKCCDTVADLWAIGGHLPKCMCCRQFADNFVSKLPLARMNLTSEEVVRGWSACGAPVYNVINGINTCPPVELPNLFRDTTFAPGDEPYARFNFSNPTFDNFMEYIGLIPELRPDRLERRGAALVANGTKQIQVVGADNFYNNYITAFVDWIERTLLPYEVPKTRPLPPLPSRFRADVAWVKTLRRGAYPAVIYLKPEELTMARADPLQNGTISRLPPAAAWRGRLPLPPVQG